MTERLSESNEKHEGVMVALFLPARVAKKLAVKNGLPAAEMHVTIGYFGKNLTDRQKQKMVTVVTDYCSDLGPVSATLGGIGRFSASKTSDGKDVAYISVDSPDITAMRPKLMAKLSAAGIKVSTDHGFVPHVTLSYIDQKAKLPLHRLEPISLKFDTITVAMGDRRTKIKLGAKHEHHSRFGNIIAEANEILGGPVKAGRTPMMRQPTVVGTPAVRKLYKPRKPMSIVTNPTSMKSGV